MKHLLTLLLCLTSHAASVTVTWDPNQEPDVDRYKVYIGDTSRTYTRTILVTGQTTAVIDGLDLGRTYYIACTALNTAGLESDYSNEVVYTVPSRPSAPGTPRVQFQSVSWEGKPTRGLIQPILVVPGDDGLKVTATISTPAGNTTKTGTITAGEVRLTGKASAAPFEATADITQVSVDPDFQTSTIIQ